MSLFHPANHAGAGPAQQPNDATRGVATRTSPKHNSRPTHPAHKSDEVDVGGASAAATLMTPHAHNNDNDSPSATVAAFAAIGFVIGMVLLVLARSASDTRIGPLVVSGLSSLFVAAFLTAWTVLKLK